MLSPDSFVRYVFVSTPKTWTEAELYCMKHYNNLVSVRSSHENTAVRNAVPVGVKAFIGLSRKPWSSWSSGSVTSFTYWALPPQVPNDGNCVASVFNHTHQGQWVESNCKKELHFMWNNSEFNLCVCMCSSVTLTKHQLTTHNILLNLVMKISIIFRQLNFTSIKSSEIQCVVISDLI